MSIACGLDLHRQQITFDASGTDFGVVWRDRVWQPAGCADAVGGEAFTVGA